MRQRGVFYIICLIFFYNLKYTMGWFNFAHMHMKFFVIVSVEVVFEVYGVFGDTSTLIQKVVYCKLHMLTK